ncbi:6817_t:CDS:2, partial [Funneliformis caledonium]
ESHDMIYAHIALVKLEINYIHVMLLKISLFMQLKRQILHTEMRPSTNTLTTNEPSKKDKEIDISEFTSLEVVKFDYQYSCQTLRIVLENLNIVITLQSQSPYPIILFPLWPLS